MLVEMNQFKRDMKQYYKECVTPEAGETFKSWWGCLMDTLLEDGSIVTDGKKKFVKC